MGQTDADDVLSYLKDLSMEYKRLAAATNPPAVFVAKKQKAYAAAAAYLKSAVDNIFKSA